MESIYTELALCGRKSLCARTDNVFFTISGVSRGTISLTEIFVEHPRSVKNLQKNSVYNINLKPNGNYFAFFSFLFYKNVRS